MSDLRRCPYCRGYEIKEIVKNLAKTGPDEWRFWYICKSCLMSGPISTQRELAKTYWNELPRRFSLWEWLSGQN